MAVKLESGQHHAKSYRQPSAVSPRFASRQKTGADVDKFASDLMRYQQRKRCNPREDFLFSSLGGMAVGGLGGAVVGAVPGLPLAGVGALVTGAAGGLAGSVLGGLVGVTGGALFAASHVHCHTPDPGNLRRHVFSHFHVVPMRHQSRRITRALVKHKVLFADDARRVMHLDDKRIDRALRDVHVFGKRLSHKQRAKVKNILHIQAFNTEAADARDMALPT